MDKYYSKLNEIIAVDGRRKENFFIKKLFKSVMYPYFSHIKYFQSGVITNNKIRPTQNLFRMIELYSFLDSLQGDSVSTRILKSLVSLLEMHIKELYFKIIITYLSDQYSIPNELNANLKNIKMDELFSMRYLNSINPIVMRRSYKYLDRDDDPNFFSEIKKKSKKNISNVEIFKNKMAKSTDINIFSEHFRKYFQLLLYGILEIEIKPDDNSVGTFTKKMILNDIYNEIKKSNYGIDTNPFKKFLKPEPKNPFLYVFSKKKKLFEKDFIPELTKSLLFFKDIATVLNSKPDLILKSNSDLILSYLDYYVTNLNSVQDIKYGGNIEYKIGMFYDNMEDLITASLDDIIYKYIEKIIKRGLTKSLNLKDNIISSDETFNVIQINNEDVKRLSNFLKIFDSV